ncbi:Uncharacterised protein [Pseudomonas aeruginosa]|nr:Uncharacterised protein [Pseudomonas aeruginosa]
MPDNAKVKAGAILYPLQDLLSPGVAQQRIMPGAMMDLVEDGEDAVVVEEPPELLVTVIHGLIGIRGPHSTEQSIQALAEYPRKGRAEAVHNLARRCETEHKIDPVLL